MCEHRGSCERVTGGRKGAIWNTRAIAQEAERPALPTAPSAGPEGGVSLTLLSLSGTELEREGCEELPTGKPGHQAHGTALQAVRKFWSKTRQNRILSWLIFSSCAPAALRSHRSVVVCIIWERKPSPFRLRPQAPKPVAGQILPAGFPFPRPLWARTPWKVLG